MHINADPTQHFLQNNVTWNSFAMSSDCGYIQNTYVFRLQSMHLSLDPNRPLKQSRMTQHHPVQNQDLSPGGPRTHKMKGEKRAVLGFTKFIICRNLIGSFLVIGFGAQSLLYYLPLNVSIFLKSASALFGVMSLRPLFSKKLKQLRSRTHSINRF